MGVDVQLFGTGVSDIRVVRLTRRLSVNYDTEVDMGLGLLIDCW